MKLFESEFCRVGLVAHRFLLIKKEKKKVAYKFYWLEVRPKGSSLERFPMLSNKKKKKRINRIK